MKPDFLELINIVFITGVVYGLTFTAMLFLMKRKMGRPIFFLNLQVLFITLNNLQAWLIDMNLISDFIYIRYMRVPWYVLCMPMFYVFLVHYLKLKRSYKVLEQTIVLFSSFVLVRVALIYYSQYQGFDEATTKAFMDRYSSIEEIICYFYTMGIFLLSLSTFYGKLNLFEKTLQYDDLTWIKHFLNLAGLVLLIWISAIWVSFGNGVFSSPKIYYPLRLSTTILIYWIGFKGLFRFRIKEDRIELRRNLKLKAGQILGEKKSIGETVHGSNKQKEQFEKVNAMVVSQRLYLDPYLSLDSLARIAQLSSGYLSSLINNYSESNFSDYINKFRVEQAKNLIDNEDFNKYTVVSIGLESGFNSKSTFYKAFRKFTGVTPTEYKNLNNSS